MPDRKYVIVGIAILWSIAPANTSAQISTIRPPMVAPRPTPITSLPRFDTNLGGSSLRMLPTPRLDSSLPNPGAAPVLNNRTSPPQVSQPAATVPMASQPNYQVQDPPPPPSQAPPDADNGTPEAKGVGIPAWVFWLALAIGFLLFLFRKEK